MNRPNISLVLTGRNDNYGGDFKVRLQNCITNAHSQLSNLSVRSEIIFVNYNPLPAPPIETFIQWPATTELVEIRILTLSPEQHKKLVAEGGRKDIPVLEYLGKNAGIRRAKGEFILSMNPDIILPKEIVSNFKELKKDCYYRADRVDYSGDFDSDFDLKRVYLKGQDYPISSLNELEQLRAKNRKVNRWRSFTPRIEWLLNLISSPVYYNSAEYNYHCNVSGDFMLMHRDSWHTLHAHHENRPIALHVDALMVVQAATSGLKEVVFDNPIFHQEHERRFDAKTDNPLFKEAFDFFVTESKKMMEAGKPEIYNGPAWGSVNFDLPEINP